MKTRVIQNEPDEQAAGERPVDPVRQRRPTNVAARMARWSAQHRKKAIFGWLAFAIVLFAISMASPMKSIVFQTSGPGESGRAPRHELPELEMDPDTVYQLVRDELMLDGNARLNLATFVSTWMEPQAERLMSECYDKNMVDKDEYPRTAELASM